MMCWDKSYRSMSGFRLLVTSLFSSIDYNGAVEVLDSKYDNNKEASDAKKVH